MLCFPQGWSVVKLLQTRGALTIVIVMSEVRLRGGISRIKIEADPWRCSL